MMLSMYIRKGRSEGTSKLATILHVKAYKQKRTIKQRGKNNRKPVDNPAIYLPGVQRVAVYILFASLIEQYQMHNRYHNIQNCQ